MVCKALDEAQAAQLASVARKRADHKGLAVLLALYAGLRRAEIAALRWSDIDENGWLRIVGKGDISASLPLHPHVLDVAADLRRARFPRGAESRRGTDYTFPGRTSGHATPASVWNWVRTVSLAAGVGEVPCHVLRHTCLATALDNTRDLRAVQELARHARPETTAGYTRVKRARMMETVMAIDYAVPA